jgi:PAS domain S-box-containing protein
VTEKRLFEVRLASMAAQLAAAYRRFELALEHSAITVFEQDADLRFGFIYNPPLGTSVEDFIGRTDAEIFREEELRRLDPPKRRVLETGERESFEVDLQLGGARRFYEITVDANRDDDGRILGLVGIALDLTDRKRDQDRMRLMMRELTHRSKNLLAVIQAMARKTATLSDDTDSFIADFSARLRAMAAAQDLLVSQSWEGADLEELIRASVAQTIAPDARQIRMTGPPLLLAPDTAQNLGLAFHELATNASKYGALAADAGELAVLWEHADGEVRICWEERGGPPVVAPDRRGFGRILLERLVGTTLNGSVSLDFRSQGLICRIVFPDSGLIAA